MTSIRLNDVQRLHQHNPTACALIDQAETILTKHGGWNDTSRDLIIRQAQALRITRQDTQAILSDIRHAATAAAAAGSHSTDEILGLLDSIHDLSTGRAAPTAGPRSPDSDPKVQDVVQQSRRAIAQERGLTVKTRALVTELIQQAGLNAEQEKTVWRLLTEERSPGGEGGAAGLGQPKTPQRKRFSDYLKQHWSAHDSGTLTTEEEQRLIDTGSSEFHLDRESSSDLIRGSRAEHGINYVSQLEAMRVIQDRLEEATPPGGDLTDDHREEIALEALRLGLSRKQFDQLAEEYRRQQSDRQERDAVRRRGRRRVFAWCLASLAAVVASFSLARVLVPTHTDDQPPEPPVLAKHAWWDRQLMVDAAAAEAVAPRLVAWHAAVKSADESRRGQLYQRLFQRQAAADDPVRPPSLSGLSDEQRNRLSHVLAGIIMNDPSADCARELVNGLCETLATPSQTQLLDPEAYRIGNWGLRTLLLVQVRRGENQAIRQVVRERLQQELEYEFELYDMLGAVVEKSTAVMLRRHYAALRRVAHDAPEQLWRIYQRVVSDGRADTSTEEFDNLKTAVLCTYIESTGHGWEMWKDTFYEEIVRKADEGRLQQYEDSLQRCQQLELRDYLSPLIDAGR